MAEAIHTAASQKSWWSVAAARYLWKYISNETLSDSCGS